MRPAGEGGGGEGPAESSRGAGLAAMLRNYADTSLTSHNSLASPRAHAAGACCRYGNPDFLREQAAKADAKLAAALPLLRAEANASSSRGSGAAGPATVAEGAAAARQLLEAARTSPGQHGLDLARYELLLLKEKKLAGGVLGSSNMAAAAAGGSAAGNGRPHSAGLLGLQHSTSAAGSHRQRDGEGVQPFKLMRSKTAVLPQQVRFSSSLVNGGRVSSDRSSAGD